MNTTLFIVFRDPGPSWIEGRHTRQQPLWDEHAVFMDGLFEAGRVVLGGPYADGSRALVIVEARNRDEAQALFDDDPWTTEELLGVGEAIEWTVYLVRGNLPDEPWSRIRSTPLAPVSGVG